MYHQRSFLLSRRDFHRRTPVLFCCFCLELFNFALVAGWAPQGPEQRSQLFHLRWDGNAGAGGGAAEGKRHWKMCSLLAFSCVSEAILMTSGKQIFPTHTVKQTELLLAVLEPSVTQGPLLVPPRAAVRCGAVLGSASGSRGS